MLVKTTARLFVILKMRSAQSYQLSISVAFLIHLYECMSNSSGGGVNSSGGGVIDFLDKETL